MPEIFNTDELGAQTWIFQGNPETFDITAAVTELKELVWLVNQRRSEMHIGHRVLMWRSGPEAGLLASCTVLTEPAVLAVPDEQRKYEVNPGRLADSEVRCRLRIDTVFSPYIAKERLRNDPGLQSLSILNNWRGTNFPVTPEEALIIAGLIAGSAEDEGDEVPPESGPA